MKKPSPVRIADPNGREWDVYEFSVIAGKTVPFDVGCGSGQYRGFAPVDGGARRRFLMLGAERHRPVTPDVLLEQLAASELDFRDDPDHTRFSGRPPERADPP